MIDLIESILLSQFLIFIMLSAMLLVVTSWAFKMKEYPGYLLGWLVGIFFIVIYASVTTDNPPGPEVQEAPQAQEVTLSLVTVALPSLFGLLSGFSTLFFMSAMTNSRVRRSLTIAVLTASLIIIIFFLVTSSELVARLIGIFALAYAIGALSTVVLGGMPDFRPEMPTNNHNHAGNDGGYGVSDAQPQDRRRQWDHLRRRVDNPYE